MVSTARSGVAAYGELDDPTRDTDLIVTELPRYPEGKRHYSWPEDYLAWLEGHEEHQGYYAWLKQAPWWEQSALVGARAIRDLDLTPPGRALATQECVAPPSTGTVDPGYRTYHNPSTAPVLVSITEMVLKKLLRHAPANPSEDVFVRRYERAFEQRQPEPSQSREGDR